MIRSWLTFGLTTAILSGQEILWHAVGRSGVEWFTNPLTFIGDVDGDGFEDLVNIGQQNQLIRSVAYVLSGRTGTLLRTRQVPVANFWYRGHVARAGDWNRDGIDDYILARYTWTAPWAPTVIEVLSGRDDAVLLQVQAASSWLVGGAEHVLCDLDTDGDGRPDLVFSVERETSQVGAVYVYANSGQLRYRLAVHYGNTNLGKVGDLDGDGCDDFGYWHSPDGTVRVVSGRTGVVILEAKGDLPNDHLGSGAIAACGDVNRDGVPDFAASSNGSYPTNGLVRVFSGKDAAPIHTFRKGFGVNGSAFGFGEAIASGFDLDQDGIQDLVVGGCMYDCDLVRGVGDRLYVYLLRDGREVEICTPDLASILHFTRFGLKVAAGRGHPGSPFPVFACGESAYGQGIDPLTYQGRISLFRLPPAALRPLGQSCSGTLGQPPRVGVVDLGLRGVRVQLSSAPPGAAAALLVGTSNQRWGGSNLPLGLDPWGFVGCQLLTSVDLWVPLTTGRQGAAAGYASLDVPLPVANNAPNGRVYTQWLVLGSGQQIPGALSAGLGWPF